MFFRLEFDIKNDDGSEIEQRFFVLPDIYGKTTMEDLNNQITLIRTELNLEQDPQKKQDLNKRLNVLNLKKEIETIKKRIEQIGWMEFK